MSENNDADAKYMGSQKMRFSDGQIIGAGKTW